MHPNKATNNPEKFAGTYFGASGSVGIKALGAGANINGQWSTSEDGSWNVLSLGASATMGPQVGLFAGGSGSAGSHIGAMHLLNAQIPTSKRSWLDIGSNWLIHPIFGL